MNELGSDKMGDLSVVTGSQDGAMIKQVVEESVARFINELNLWSLQLIVMDLIEFYYFILKYLIVFKR